MSVFLGLCVKFTSSIWWSTSSSSFLRNGTCEVNSLSSSERKRISCPRLISYKLTSQEVLTSFKAQLKQGKPSASGNQFWSSTSIRPQEKGWCFTNHEHWWHKAHHNLPLHTAATSRLDLSPLIIPREGLVLSPIKNSVLAISFCQVLLPLYLDL